MRDHESKYPLYNNCPQSHHSILPFDDHKIRKHHAKSSHSELKTTYIHNKIEAIQSPVQDSERNMADLENRATGRLGISKVKPNCQTYVECSTVSKLQRKHWYQARKARRTGLLIYLSTLECAIVHSRVRFMTQEVRFYFQTDLHHGLNPHL